MRCIFKGRHMAVRVCSLTVCGKQCRKLVLIVAWGKTLGGQCPGGGEPRFYTLYSFFISAFKNMDVWVPCSAFLNYFHYSVSFLETLS